MEKDSNLRRHRQQIYSLSPLATRESIRERDLLYTIEVGFARCFFSFFETLCARGMKKRINNSFFLQRGRRMGKNLLNYRQWK